MTGKERITRAIRFEETDRVPHFETMFELEQEAFGMRFPDRNSWASCSQAQKERQIGTCMEVYGRIIERFGWDALAVYWPWADPDGVAAAKREFGQEVLIGGIMSQTVWSIEIISDWEAFSMALFDKQADLHAQAKQRCRAALDVIDRLIDAGADFVYLANDIAFNAGPFLSPRHIGEFVTPYLTRQVQHIKNRGALAFIHTDGMIMPILDQLVNTGADVLQSIDPMAGMDIAAVKRFCGGRMALMGNVQCNLLQEGPDEAIRKSALYCLEHASAGGGYIYSSSNTIFPGMPLKNYEYMLSVLEGWHWKQRLV